MMTLSLKLVMSLQAFKFNLQLLVEFVNSLLFQQCSWPLGENKRLANVREYRSSLSTKLTFRCQCQNNISFFSSAKCWKTYDHGHASYGSQWLHFEHCAVPRQATFHWNWSPSRNWNWWQTSKCKQLTAGVTFTTPIAHVVFRRFGTDIWHFIICFLKLLVFGGGGCVHFWLFLCKCKVMQRQFFLCYISDFSPHTKSGFLLLLADDNFCKSPNMNPLPPPPPLPPILQKSHCVSDQPQNNSRLQDEMNP